MAIPRLARKRLGLPAHGGAETRNAFRGGFAFGLEGLEIAAGEAGVAETLIDGRDVVDAFQAAGAGNSLLAAGLALFGCKSGACGSGAHVHHLPCAGAGPAVVREEVLWDEREKESRAL